MHDLIRSLFGELYYKKGKSFNKNFFKLTNEFTLLTNSLLEVAIYMYLETTTVDDRC
jgi:hypothetical protein